MDQPTINNKADSLLRLVHQLIKAVDSGKTKYMFVVSVDEAGDAFTSIVGDHNIYQVAGFVNTRLNALIAEYEAAYTTEDEDGKESINEYR